MLYTGLVAFISFVFLLAPMEVVNWRMWEYWLALNWLMTWVFFRLLIRFEEGILFWVVLLLGVVVVLNEPNLLMLWMALLWQWLH